MLSSPLLRLLSCVLAAAACANLTAQIAPPAGLRFTENLGQHGDAALYSTSIGAVRVLFEPDAMVVHGAATAPIDGPGVKVIGAPERPVVPTLPEVDVRFGFAGADPSARLVSHDQLPGIENVYIGRDPSRWKSGLRAWASLSYEGLWPGITLDLHERDGTLHYDVVVAPGAELGAFGLRVDGFDTSIESDGSLRIETPRGTLRQTIPAAWDEDGDQRLPVAARFELREDGTVGLVAPDHDPALRLVVDPGLDVFAGFGAGLLDAEFYALAVQPRTDLQIAGGYVGPDALVRSSDIVTGFLVFSTLFDGLGADAIVGVTCNEIGDIYVSGVTDSLALPTTVGAFLVFAPGAGDAFVAHLNPIGFLLQMTYVGGPGGTEASNTAIDIGPTGDVFLAGYTESALFPIVPPFVVGPFYGGAGDAYVMQLDPTLAVDLASSFLGGALADYPGVGGIGVAEDGTIAVGGFTDSPGFPVVAAFDPLHGGVTDGWLAKLFPGFLAFSFSTFQGGPGVDAFNAVGVDDEANVWGAGYTESGVGLPGLGPPAVLDVTYNGAGDVYVVKHDPFGLFLWGTYRGGSGGDTAIGLAVDRFGRAHWTGTTNSGIPPSVVPYPITPIDGVGPFAGFEGFLDEVGPDGDIESFSTYLDILSPADDQLWAIALGSDDSAYVAGSTYPLVVGPATAQLSRVTLPWFEFISPLTNLGFALAGTTEPQLMGDGQLVAGTPVEIRISNCVPFSFATLIFGLGPPALAPFLGGVLVPPPTFLFPGLPTGFAGEMVLPAIWPPGIPAGTPLFFQAWIPDPLGPAGFAATDAIYTDPP